MKKAIIFILGVSSCISGSAPQAKLVIPRKYNAEATQKLQEKMTAILKLLNDMKTAMYKIQASSLSEIESLIKDKEADPNTKVHIKTAFGGERDVSFFDFILTIVLSVEESNYSLVASIIKTALQHGMNMVIQPNDLMFIETLREITGDSPNDIMEILNAVENPQQKEQNLNSIKKLLPGYIDQGKKQIQDIESKNDKVRQILEALDSIKVQPAGVNIKQANT